MKICECGHDESIHHHGVCGHRACHIGGGCYGWVEDWRPRMEALERVVETLAATLEKRPYSYIQVGASEPEKVREEQDDA